MRKIKTIFSRRIVFSLLSALFLIVVGYFANNSPVFTGETVEQYYITQRICSFLGFHKNVDYGDVIFFNVSYDKQLIPHINSAGIPVGNDVITDRSDVARFLELLGKSDKYRFVILDMVFDKNDRSEGDSLLHDALKNTPRLVFGNHERVKPLFPDLGDKSAEANFYATLFSKNFSRYLYLDNGKMTIPLYTFLQLNPDVKVATKGSGPFTLYFVDGRLAQNTNYLTFDNYDYTSPRTESFGDNFLEDNNYVNMGEFLHETLTPEDEELIEELDMITQGKIVIVGNLMDDIHDTYVGQKPGPVIIARALQTLEERKNIVSFWNLLYWFVIFAGISYVLYGNPARQRVVRMKESNSASSTMSVGMKRLLGFLGLVITYTSILVIFSVIEYIFADRVYSLAVPVIYFALLKLYTQYRDL